VEFFALIEFAVIAFCFLRRNKGKVRKILIFGDCIGMKHLIFM
jgi:hypothetical protein